jgi:O-antigen ligase
LILWLHAGLAREVHWVRSLAGCMLAMVCLLLSRSATSLIAATLASVVLTMLLASPRGFRPFAALGVAMLTLFLMLYALALLQLVPGLRLLLAPITALTEVDTSFTGRSYIWNIITEHASQNPVLGTGYGAYWAGPTSDSPSYEFILRMGAFYPGSAHNGYLEVLNDLGWVGLIVLMGYLLAFLLQSLRMFGAERRQGALYLTLLIHQAVANLSESHWLNVLSLHFVIMTLATLCLGRLLLELRLRARFGHPVVPVAWTHRYRGALPARAPALHPALAAPRA